LIFKNDTLQLHNITINNIRTKKNIAYERTIVVITKMNSNSSSSNPFRPTTTAATTKSTAIHNGSNKNALDNTVAINEKINLTKRQYKILNIICNSYEMSISKYMQEALVQTMRSDIEDGDLSDVLLDRLEEDDNNNKSRHVPSASDTANER
jgi:activator of HSP90 ATPase